MSEKGKVKWFTNVKGYGFLEQEGGDKDVFVHYSEIQSDGYKTLKSGEEVTFEVKDGEKGPVAVKVIRVAKPPKEEPKEEAPAEEAKEEAPAADAEAPQEEAKAEEPKEEAPKEEPKAEEPKEEAPKEEAPAEEAKAEEPSKEAAEEEKPAE